MATKPMNWGTKQHFYTPMSAATCTNYKSEKLWTSGIEAFIYILIVSNYTKWEAMGKYYEQHNDYERPLPEAPGKDDDGNKLPDIYRTALYTTQDGGQQKFGTFSKEGVKAFVAIKKELHAQRVDDDEKEAMLAKEKSFLELLRKEHNKTGKTHADESKPSKKRKQGDAPDGDGIDNDEAMECFEEE